MEESRPLESVESGRSHDCSSITTYKFGTFKTCAYQQIGRLETLRILVRRKHIAYWRLYILYLIRYTRRLIVYYVVFEREARSCPTMAMRVGLNSRGKSRV